MSQLQQTVHASSDMLSSRVDAIESAVLHASSLTLTVAALDTRLTKISTDNEDLAEHCNRKLANSTEESQMQCLKLSERLAAVSAEVAESRTIAARLQATSTEQSHALSGLQQCLDTSEHKAAQLSSRVQTVESDLEDSCSRLTKEQEDMKQRINTVDTLNQRLNVQLADWKLQCSVDSEAVANELRANLHELDGKMKGCLREFESFALRLQFLSAELKHVSEVDTATAKQMLDNQIERLESKLSILTNDCQHTLLELRAAADYDKKLLDQLLLKVLQLCTSTCCSSPATRYSVQVCTLLHRFSHWKPSVRRTSEHIISAHLKWRHKGQTRTLRCKRL
jgi:chromosome segregation ATPase